MYTFRIEVHARGFFGAREYVPSGNHKAYQKGAFTIVFGGESLVKCPNCGAGMKLDTLGINICPKGHGYFVPASIIGIHDLEEAVRNANPK